MPTLSAGDQETLRGEIATMLSRRGDTTIPITKAEAAVVVAEIDATIDQLETALLSQISNQEAVSWIAADMSMARQLFAILTAKRAEVF